ncbi:hypothetical protein KQH89_11920, partial [Vibrio cholerae]|uniref:hypothetical protein n=1 Tax=Vibrio cholerae TaxID=666 RepID=UPI001C0FA40F
LSYRVSAPLLMPPVESFRTSVNVDKTAPNFGNPGLELIFDPEVLSGGVTEDYLAKNGGVPAEAQRWVDVRLE